MKASTAIKRKQKMCKYLKYIKKKKDNIDKTKTNINIRTTRRQNIYTICKKKQKNHL
jgi:hypothetical protein